MKQSTKIIAGLAAIAIIGGGIYTGLSHKSTQNGQAKNAHKDKSRLLIKNTVEKHTARDGCCAPKYPVLM